MNMALDTSFTSGYHGGTQRARVMTEGWVSRELYCPRCGSPRVTHLANNSPVADFECPLCASQFELKSKSGAWSNKVNDGTYSTLISRMTSDTNPDWLFMGYSKETYAVTHLFMVPKHFFTPSIVEKRKPLPPTARRAGWIGAIITLSRVPVQGRVVLVRDGVPVNRDSVSSSMKVADSLAVKGMEARGWLMDVLECVNAIEGQEFLLADVYAFEDNLQVMHPDNHNIRPKIRQQLQVLRDRGLLEFVGRGRYRKVTNAWAHTPS